MANQQMQQSRGISYEQLMNLFRGIQGNQTAMIDRIQGPRGIQRADDPVTGFGNRGAGGLDRFYQNNPHLTPGVYDNGEGAREMKAQRDHQLWMADQGRQQERRDVMASQQPQQAVTMPFGPSDPRYQQGAKANQPMGMVEPQGPPSSAQFFMPDSSPPDVNALNASAALKFSNGQSASAPSAHVPMQNKGGLRQGPAYVNDAMKNWATVVPDTQSAESAYAQMEAFFPWLGMFQQSPASAQPAQPPVQPQYLTPAQLSKQAPKGQFGGSAVDIATRDFVNAFNQANLPQGKPTYGMTPAQISALTKKR